jgi:hypothetical protein
LAEEIPPSLPRAPEAALFGGIALELQPAGIPQIQYPRHQTRASTATHFE